jgi:hypothetical protein
MPKRLGPTILSERSESKGMDGGARRPRSRSGAKRSDERL